MHQLISNIILALLCLSFSIVSFSQIELTIVDESNLVLFKKIQVKDSVSAVLFSQKELIKWQSQGYISSFYKTELWSDSLVSLKLINGDKYRWGELILNNKIASFFEQKFQSDFSVNPSNVDKLVKQVLTHFENSGYPFVQVYFDSISVENNKISGRLDVRKNQFVVLDSLIVKGGSKTSKEYLIKWLGLKIGEAYNQEVISSLRSKLRNLDVVSVIRDPEVYFTPGKAELVLYLEDNSSNRFDGILGLNPDENNGKINVVGELKIDLKNAFKRGESIYLNWEKVKTNSQNFVIDFSYPFLFKTRFGLNTKFNYFRQDTSFANLNGLLGLSYFINESQEFSISVEVIESNSLASNADLSQVPSVNSVSTIYYGVAYKLNTLDYRLNPRRGWRVGLNLRTGNKSISKNPEIESINYQELTETSRQLKSDFSVSYFLPLFKRSTAHLKLQSGNLIGDNVFVNELYQIGGSKTLRGFNQQSILASNYYIFTTEFRYLFSQNSNFFGFFDLGFYENNSIDSYQRDVPFGFGLGVNFQTVAGVFSMSYGLGSQQNNPILVKNGKVHFGFVSLF